MYSCRRLVREVRAPQQGAAARSRRPVSSHALLLCALQPVNRAARLMTAAQGGQVVLDQSLLEEVRRGLRH